MERRQEEGARLRQTETLGVEVTVERIDLTDDEQIVAVCSRDKP